MFSWHALEMEVGDIGVVRDGDGGYWVGKIVELMKVVWEPEASEQIEGDVKMHEFGTISNEGWKGPQYPMFNKGSGIGKAKVVKNPTASHTPLHTVVWAESLAMWGSERKMLQTKGRKLKKNAVGQLNR